MEDRDLEALGRGLGSALGDTIARALDQSVGDSARERRRAADAADGHAAELERRRADAVEACKRRWRAEREAAADEAERAVRAYCGKALEKVAERGVEDPRMPSEINYRERYHAFRSIDERRELLRRIEQTLDLADAAVAGAGALDGDAFLSEQAEWFRESVAALGQLAVAEADDDAAGCACAAGPGGALAAGDDAAEGYYRDAMDVLMSQADAAFADGLGECDGPDGQAGGACGEAARRAELDRLSERLRQAAARADERLEASAAANAAAVGGSKMPLGDLPAYAGRAKCGLRFDPAEVADFGAEVRRAFAKYKQVVMDNGVFAAFSDGSDFGRCNGFSAWFQNWDDWDMEDWDCDLSVYCGDRPGARPQEDIATNIEEDDVEGGDAPERAAEKLRQLNAKRYFGMLDDDYAEHVDAFWYGFRKLMEFASGLYEVKSRPFAKYTGALQDAAVKRARALGVMMDESQLKDFRKQVKRLQRKL